MSEMLCGHCGETKPISDAELKIYKAGKEKNERQIWVCNECYGPDWSGKCSECGESPIMPVTGMCGPCTTGDSDTAGGNW